MILYSVCGAGPIPNSFENLNQLTQLWLHKNELTPELTVTIVEMIATRGVDVKFNKGFMLPFALGDADPAIRGLDLSRRGLAGPIPTSIGQLTGLTHLLLANNNLTGEWLRMYELFVRACVHACLCVCMVSCVRVTGQPLGQSLVFRDGRQNLWCYERHAGDASLRRLLTTCRLLDQLVGGWIDVRIGSYAIRCTCFIAFTGWLTGPSENPQLRLKNSLHCFPTAGPIPSAIGNLSSLVKLDCRGNKLAGE